MRTELARRETIPALVGTYKQAVADIEQAYALLDSARSTLRATFKDTLDVIRRNNCGDTGPKEVSAVIKGIKRYAWAGMVDRMEIRKLLSIARREQLDKQLSGDTGRSYDPIPDLPEITEENIFAMFQDSMANATVYANEAVYEVFDWLRPRAGRLSELKTNDKWKIGKKVIIGHMVEMGFSKGQPFRPRYDAEKRLIALDNVFHMLDGRGPIKGHYGPLCEAIKTSPDGTGTTDFFRFKCCKNHNLHIEFLRADLVNKINKTAGGNRLKGGAAHSRAV